MNKKNSEYKEQMIREVEKKLEEQQRRNSLQNPDSK